MLKKSLKLMTAFLAAGTICLSIAYAHPSYAYADDVTTTATEEVSAPHFDTSGFAVVNDIKYHKTGDRTVEVYKGVDTEEEIINIPSEICVDGVTYNVISIGSSAFYNIPETKEIVDEDGNIVNHTDEMVPFRAKKIILPQSITAIGNDCFYGLVNIQSLDLTYVTSIGVTSLHMAPNAVLDRVKLGNNNDSYFNYGLVTWSNGTQQVRLPLFNHYQFKRIEFRKMDTSVSSKWLVKSNVRINELQDPETKDGYYFSGWKQNTYIKDNYQRVDSGRGFTDANGNVYNSGGTYNFQETYTYYTPSYEEGQTLTDMEDKLKEVMSTMVVTVNTRESDIFAMVDSCQNKNYNNIGYTIDNFRVIEPQPENDVKGAVRCTINLTDKIDGSTKSVNFDIAITEAPVFPTEAKLKEYVDSYNEYTVSTTSDDLVKYISQFIDDKRLTVKINNFTNDTYHVHGNLIITNTVDNTTKQIYISKAVYSKIDAIVEYAIKNLIVDASSNESYIVNQIKNVIADDRYNVKICDFTNSNGCVFGTVVTGDQYGTICINQLNAASNFSAIVDEKAVNEALNNMSVGASTTSNDVINALRPVVNNDLFTIVIDNFCNDNGNVTGTAVITKVDGTVTKFPFAKTYVNTVTNPSGNLNSGSQSQTSGTQSGTTVTPSTGTSSGNVNTGSVTSPIVNTPAGTTGSSTTVGNTPSGTIGGSITVGNTSVSSPVNVVVLGGGSGSNASNTAVTYEDLLKLLLQLNGNNGQTTVVTA